jgi:hypothetical protein
MRRLLTIAGVGFATVLLVSFGYVGSSTASSVGNLALFGIDQQSSGLVAQDLLTSTLSQQQLQSSSLWKFNGDAVGEHASYAYYENPSGLHLGVSGIAGSDPWAGIFAVAKLNSQLTHVVITVPSRTIPNGYYVSGIYMQTSSVDVDYVTCGATTSSYGTVWSVEEATGNPYGATNMVQLWVDNSANQPLTRSCTMITNGQNYLAVYLDNSLVYQTSSLSLDYQFPLFVFLETESSYSGSVLYGSFTNFYATTASQVTVNNMPIAATEAAIVDSSGKVISSAPVYGSTAFIDIGGFTFPVHAKVVVYGPLGIELASTNGMKDIFGGDVYSVQDH